jgi:hypothetical protein
MSKQPFNSDARYCLTRHITLITRTMFVRAIILSLLFVAIFAATPSTTQAQRSSRRKSVDYGRIEITTNPAGYPILIDGRPSGETTATVRNIDLEPGQRRVEIQFPNNTRWVRDFNILAGRRECINLNFRPRTVTLERMVSSPCPYTVAVSAPNSVSDGDLITFTSDVVYDGPRALNYTWTVSPASARITQGIGTPTVTVDSTGLGRNRVTAILVVDDGSGDRSCRQSAQASTGIIATPIAVNKPRRFDEFPSVSFDDDKARLDNLAIELQNDPTARAYVIVYGGERSRPGTADRLGNRANNYLTQTRGIDPSRVTVVNGGTRERNYFELYIVPQGAEPPQPTPR